MLTYVTKYLGNFYQLLIDIKVFPR